MSHSLVAPSAAAVLADVRRALQEDMGPGDASADLVPAHVMAEATVICRDAAVICGAPWFDACLRELDPDMHIEWLVNDGDHVAADTLLCHLQGRARALLSGERSALNFLQTLSATATVSAAYVAAVAGTDTTILDTRKTLPGLRVAQKYAVRCGGGSNHRMGLHDAILIKENHITAAGNLTTAVLTARTKHPSLPLEVEVEDLQELELALLAGVDRIMLDEFDDDMIRHAVARVDGQVPLEVSGSVELPRLASLARMGVDYISIGALTKHIRAVDLSMRINFRR
ncbi:MAG: carboxylating nicotinate-nucleotide diphosphorylase [Xanthomonadales bacterium]|nr:carboxylating nicotinate-nucleotide diphosphorylase [Xanthomonadales bacterium]